MKSKTLLSLSIAAIIGTTIYAPISAAALPFLTKQSTPTTETVAQKKTDGQIISILVALNNNEITGAQDAQQKTTNHSVKRYASMLQREHTKNLDKTLKLSQELGIAPVPTSTANMLMRDGKKEVKTLAPLTGNNFDVAYINDMVKDHTAALKLIDTNLLKNVSNPALKSQIERTRPHIAAHLVKAQKIQQQLAAH
jgi:putative membrane protein